MSAYSNYSNTYATNNANNNKISTQPTIYQQVVQNAVSASTAQTSHTQTQTQAQIQAQSQSQSQMTMPVSSSSTSSTATTLLNAPNTIIVKKNINKIDELKQDDFVDLDFVDVQINLQFLSVLKENEKIMILDNKHMQVDKRQSIMRYLYSDSRQKTMRFINHVVECAKKYCKEEKEKTFRNADKLTQIKKLLENSLDGLRNLLTTYKTDKNVCSIIKIYETNIDTFCKTELAKIL